VDALSPSSLSLAPLSRARLLGGGCTAAASAGAREVDGLSPPPLLPVSRARLHGDGCDADVSGLFRGGWKKKRSDRPRG
jgi:hypothetical protein